MSRPAAAADALPPSARAIALLVASTPGVHDAQPGVLHQLLEFAHRYAGQVLQDAQVYSEHAGRTGRVEMEDVTLAVQARVGWEFGGRVPKDYVHALAAQINNVPLPAVPEVFGVRLPPASECLTAVDFDLVPNPPPPEVKFYDEEVEEIEEESEEEEEEEDMPEHVGHPHTPAAHARYPSTAQSEDAMMQDGSSAPAGSPERELPPVRPVVLDEDDDEDDDDLFAGGDDDDDAGDDAMDTQVDAPPPVQRALVEDDDYD